MTDVCTHTDQIKMIEPEDVEGCEECLKTGSSWVHLRMCMSCGTVLCCDSSPNKHATKHHNETQHPLIRSVEPGEAWAWCYFDKVMMALR